MKAADLNRQTHQGCTVTGTDTHGRRRVIRVHNIAAGRAQAARTVARMITPTHTLVITRDDESLTHLSAYRPVTEEDVRDHYRARITCSDPEACDVWYECPKDGHCDPEDVGYEATVFHGVEHQWLYPAGSWCVPVPECAAALAEWDIPEDIDTSVDGTYPVELEWDDEWLTVLLLKAES